MNQEIPVSLDERLSEIEAKLTLSEDLLESLNLTVYQQQQTIDRLGSELRLLHEQLAALSAATEASSPLDQLPPHY